MIRDSSWEDGLTELPTVKKAEAWQQVFLRWHGVSGDGALQSNIHSRIQGL